MPEVIRLVVMRCVWFPPGLRNVENRRLERSIPICHETVPVWWNRFGPMFAEVIRRRQVSRILGFPHWRWHLDEAFAKINGERLRFETIPRTIRRLHHLRRAIDHKGETLESRGAKRRDESMTLPLWRRH